MVSHSSSRKHAVVLGGGMAGLFAARVLTEHFERVSLIERDYYPVDPVFRPGVPQGRQLHILLLRGQRILEELFPGIQQSSVARGATELDYMKDWYTYTPGGWLARIPSRQQGYVCSRHLIEWQIRQS